MRKNPDDLANQTVAMIIEECKKQKKFFLKLMESEVELDFQNSAEEYGKQWFANYIHMRIEEKEKELYDD